MKGFMHLDHELYLELGLEFEQMKYGHLINCEE